MEACAAGHRSAPLVQPGLPVVPRTKSTALSVIVGVLLFFEGDGDDLFGFVCDGEGDGGFWSVGLAAMEGRDFVGMAGDEVEWEDIIEVGGVAAAGACEGGGGVGLIGYGYGGGDALAVGFVEDADEDADFACGRGGFFPGVAGGDIDGVDLA